MCFSGPPLGLPSRQRYDYNPHHHHQRRCKLHFLREQELSRTIRPLPLTLEPNPIPPIQLPAPILIPFRSVTPPAVRQPRRALTAIAEINVEQGDILASRPSAPERAVRPMPRQSRRNRRPQRLDLSKGTTRLGERMDTLYHILVSIHAIVNDYDADYELTPTQGDFIRTPRANQWPPYPLTPIIDPDLYDFLHNSSAQTVPGALDLAYEHGSAIDDRRTEGKYERLSIVQSAPLPYRLSPISPLTLTHPEESSAVPIPVWLSPSARFSPMTLSHSVPDASWRGGGRQYRIDLDTMGYCGNLASPHRARGSISDGKGYEEIVSVEISRRGSPVYGIYNGKELGCVEGEGDNFDHEA